MIRRRDGLFAYQLAVVVDDADQDITDVVRGADLLDSTAWQIELQRALGYSHPATPTCRWSPPRMAANSPNRAASVPPDLSHPGQVLLADPGVAAHNGPRPNWPDLNPREVLEVGDFELEPDPFDRDYDRCQRSEQRPPPRSNTCQINSELPFASTVVLR